MRIIFSNTNKLMKLKVNLKQPDVTITFSSNENTVSWNKFRYLQNI